MILCLGIAADDTFAYTLDRFARAGARFCALDLVQLALAGDVSVELDDPCSLRFLVSGAWIACADFCSVYARLVDVSQAAPTAVLRERTQGLHRLLARALSALPIPVLNPPLRDNSNFSKLVHAAELARACGVRVPRSCLTSEPEEARAFVDSCDGDVIYKGASARKTWVTTYLRERDEARLPLLPGSPVLFQERIRGPDVRVHVVADSCFAEAIESPDVDYRLGKKNSYRPIELPAHIAAACALLTRHMETPFLGVDFKFETKTGDWFFLEANTQPCYQGYNRRAGGGISNALLGWLSR